MMIILIAFVILLLGYAKFNVLINSNYADKIISYIMNIVVILQLRSLTIQSKVLKLDAMEKVKKHIEDIDKNEIFKLPKELICNTEQFDHLPPRRKSNRMFYTSNKCSLNTKQICICNKLNKKQLFKVKQCINSLNDITQMIEEGIITFETVLSNYHVLILRLAYIIEPIRQMEENKNGGNYGHRVLRLRHMAYCYNYIHSKHRSIPIFIRMNVGKTENIEIINNKETNIIKILYYIILYYRVKYDI